MSTVPPDQMLHATIHLPGTNGEARLREWVASEGGIVDKDVRTVPTSIELWELDLPIRDKSSIIRALAEQRVRTFRQLCALTEEGLLAKDEITWRRYRMIVVALHQLEAPRYLKNAPPPEELLELLDLHQNTYVSLRRITCNGSNELYYTRVSQITGYDLVTAKRSFSRSTFDELITVLREVGRDFAPYYDDRTIGDVLKYEVELNRWPYLPSRTIGDILRQLGWDQLGLPATKPINELTPELLGVLAQIKPGKTLERLRLLLAEDHKRRCRRQLAATPAAA